MMCKVDRISDKYNLVKPDQRLRQRYNCEETGVRDLERFFNTMVLKRALQKTGNSVVEGEAENYHRLLTGEEVSDTAREEAKTQLRDVGVNVEEVTKDMVSYQTIRKHLNECLNIDTSKTYNPNPNQDKADLQNLAGRTATIAEKTVEKLQRNGVAEIESPSVTVDIRLRCDSCNRTHDLIAFLQHPVCECRDSDNTESTETSLS